MHDLDAHPWVICDAGVRHDLMLCSISVSSMRVSASDSDRMLASEGFSERSMRSSYAISRSPVARRRSPSVGVAARRQRPPHLVDARSSSLPQPGWEPLTAREEVVVLPDPETVKPNHAVFFLEQRVDSFHESLWL